jgi:hypothetical protein
MLARMMATTPPADAPPISHIAAAPRHRSEGQVRGRVARSAGCRDEDLREHCQQEYRPIITTTLIARDRCGRVMKKN